MEIAFMKIPVSLKNILYIKKSKHKCNKNKIKI